MTAEMNSEGSNYLKTKVTGQSEDFFENRNFFKGSVVKFMKFLRSSNSVEIWLFLQFDYFKQESWLRFLLLVPVIFLLIFLLTARWILRKTD
jgi:ABC-type Fe3+-siderophore transport system permease subunit